MATLNIPNICGANANLGDVLNQVNSLKNSLKANLEAEASTMASALTSDLTTLNLNVKKLIPDIKINDIEKGTAGVRAQPIENNGELVMDFRVQRDNNQIHILNAQSPAATSSLAFADYVIENYIN